MNKEEKIAVDKYNKGVKHSVSTFIDEDTIIAGYGKLDYDFEFPLPTKIIKEIYGTTSWAQYFINKGLYKYLTTNKDTKEQSITPYFTDEEFEVVKRDNPNFTFEKL